jgi:inner membrane protein involved in colicin E2 resistance
MQDAGGSLLMKFTLTIWEIKYPGNVITPKPSTYRWMLESNDMTIVSNTEEKTRKEAIYYARAFSKELNIKEAFDSEIKYKSRYVGGFML